MNFLDKLTDKPNLKYSFGRGWGRGEGWGRGRGVGECF